MKSSEVFETFLNNLRVIHEEYRIATLTEQEMNDLSQDILHMIEFGKGNEHELYLKLKEARIERRKAKDYIIMTQSAIDWIEENSKVIKDMEQLLGKVRGTEKKTENRIYTPKVMEIEKVET